MGWSITGRASARLRPSACRSFACDVTMLKARVEVCVSEPESRRDPPRRSLRCHRGCMWNQSAPLFLALDRSATSPHRRNLQAPQELPERPEKLCSPQRYIGNPSVIRKQKRRPESSRCWLRIAGVTDCSHHTRGEGYHEVCVGFVATRNRPGGCGTGSTWLTHRRAARSAR